MFSTRKVFLRSCARRSDTARNRMLHESQNKASHHSDIQGHAMKLAKIIITLLSASFTFSQAADVRRKPQIFGEWWQVAGDPDLGDLSNPKQQPVDFAVWQASDGTWQLWSCIRNTKETGRTRLFYRWEGAKLTDSN